MLKIRTILLILFLGCAILTTKSQEATKSAHKLTTITKGNPLAMLWGPVPFTAEFRYMQEYVIAKNQSVQVGFSYLGKSPVFSLIESAAAAAGGVNNPDFFISGYRVQAWHKIYFIKSQQDYKNGRMLAPVGFYFAPQTSYSTAVITTKYLNSNDIYIRGTHFNINAMMGVQLIAGRFAIDFFAGLGYKKNTWVERFSTARVTNLNPQDLGFGNHYAGNLKLNAGFNLGFGHQH